MEKKVKKQNRDEKKGGEEKKLSHPSSLESA